MRAHVLAWERLAEAVERPSGFRFDPERERAEQAIDATFDEVESIARSYRARLPAPCRAIPPTV